MYIGNFVLKTVFWEVRKALAIQIMTSAMTELGKGIVDAAKFVTATTVFQEDGFMHISLHQISTLAHSMT